MLCVVLTALTHIHYLLDMTYVLIVVKYCTQGTVPLWCIQIY